MKKLLVLAIILRLLVAMFYFHPDIKTFNFQASFLGKGVTDIYSYLLENRQQLPLKEEFVYFPLTYFTLGGYQMLASPILGDNFVSWLANASSNDNMADPNIFKYLLVLKLPYLICDLLIAYLLLKWAGKNAYLLWLFNPFTIFLIYGYSNIDIFPVLLTVVSFMLFTKGKNLSGAIILGLAAGFKLYPLLFTPFLFLYGKTMKEKLTLSLVPWLVFGLICLPFFSTNFVNSALVSGLSTGVLKSQLGILGISVLFFYAAGVAKKVDISKYWIALFLIIFSFPLYHIQWLLWIAPFLVILVAQKPKLSWLVFLIAIAACAIPFLYEDRFMTLGLLRVYSLLYDSLPTPFVVLEQVYDPYTLRDAIHAAMAGASGVLIYKLLRKEKAL